jgi:hypothetical protein
MVISAVLAGSGTIINNVSCRLKNHSTLGHCGYSGTTNIPRIKRINIPMGSIRI